MELREYVSQKLFYDDNNYDNYSMRREYIVDRLLDLKCESAGILSVTDTSFLRKRLGILGRVETIEEIAESWHKNPKVLEIIEYEIYQKIRDFYRMKKKVNKERMSSLSAHPEAERLYNISITRFNNTDEFKILRKKLGEYRLGYILRDSKNSIISKCGNSYLIDLIHSINGKFVDELSEKDRYYVIRKSPLETILNSCSEWLVTFAQNNNMIFYPHSVREFIIAGEFGLVDKDLVTSVLKRFGIDIMYPIVYRGNEAIMITKDNVLDMSIEGLGLPEELYKKISNGISGYNVLDFVTFGSTDKLCGEEIGFISEMLGKMNLKMVDDIGEARIIK